MTFLNSFIQITFLWCTFCPQLFIQQSNASTWRWSGGRAIRIQIGTSPRSLSALWCQSLGNFKIQESPRCLGKILIFLKWNLQESAPRPHRVFPNKISKKMGGVWEEHHDALLASEFLGTASCFGFMNCRLDDSMEESGCESHVSWANFRWPGGGFCCSLNVSNLQCE